MRYSLKSLFAIPAGPGAYRVYADIGLPGLSLDVGSGPVYIGKADAGLARRIRDEHLGDTGRSTLRRSYAALLKDELRLSCVPRPSRGPAKDINFTNFALGGAGESTLTRWMEAHLSFEVELAADPASVEGVWLALGCPPLNLTGCANPHAVAVKAARKRCADEARRAVVQ